MSLATNYVFGRKYQNPIADGIVHSYRMNELSGLMVDTTGSVNGTFASLPLYNVTGKVGKSINVRSAGQYSIMNSVLNITSYPFAYKLWIKPHTLLPTDNTSGLLINSIGHNYCGVCIFMSSNKLTIMFGNNGGTGPANRRSYKTNDIIYLNTWYQIHLNVTAFGVFDLYINGSLYTGGYTVSGTATTANLSSARYDVARGVRCVLDEFYIWNRALTSAEVLEMYSLENSGVAIY